MSVTIPSLRGAIAVPGWAKNELWRKARALPSLDLRFADSKSLVDARTGQSLVAFTRASSGTFVGSDGLIAAAATDVPRFDHNPTTGESLGLLVEEQRTNLAAYSEDATQWGAGGNMGTTLSNQTTAPDGTTTADKIVENTANSIHFLSQSQTTSYTSGVAYTRFIFVKAAGRSLAALYLPGPNFATPGSGASFDLSRGVVIYSEPGVTARIESYPNNWFRLSITATAINTGAGHVGGIQLSDNASFFSYTGDGVSGLFVWGAQLEAGAFPTSYIKTEAAAATRSADIASITGTNFSGWYRQDEGTVFAEGRSPSTVRVLTAIDDGSMSNRFQVTIAGSYTPNFAAVSGGSVSADIYTAALSQGSLVSAAAAYRVNDFALSSNGSSVSTDTVGVLPVSPSVARLGVFQSGSGYLNGTIRRLCFWPTRLANATLQRITQ